VVDMGNNGDVAKIHVRSSLNGVADIYFNLSRDHI
jgi:hypothetical protein